MRKRGIGMAFVVILGALLSAQPPARAVLVTNDGALHLQAWRAASSGYESFWEATPRSADADGATRRTEIMISGRDAMPVVCDLDRDGSNDLLIMDGLGITVYGKTPAYLPFDTVAAGSGPQGTLAAADIDGDGTLEIATQRNTSNSRQIEVWQVGKGRLQKLWGDQAAGSGSFLLFGDVDGDRKVEIVSGTLDSSRTIEIYKHGAGSTWEKAATLANKAGYETSGRLADVDGDGVRELIVGGTSGKVTVYKHRRDGEPSAYDILWQSPALVPQEAGPAGTQAPRAVVSAVETGDVDGDGRLEIIAASYVVGKPAGQAQGAGRIHVFKPETGGAFGTAWVSDWTQTPRTSGLAIGDLNGDGLNEIVYNGRDIYGYDAAAKGFKLDRSIGGAARDAVVAVLAEMREPTTATRIVPLYWTLPNRTIASGQTAEVALTLMNVWAPARDITVKVTPASANLQADSTVTVAGPVPARSSVVTQKFTVAARGDDPTGVLEVEVAAAGGYRQTVPVELRVTPPLPTYDAANLDAHIAEAEAKAREENRRVLVTWGSNADKASQALVESTVRNSEVSQKLLYEYFIVRADPAGNEAVAAKLGADLKGAALPLLTVLDADGKVLANETAATFKGAAAASAYDPKALVAFLAKHQAPYLNAEPLLAGALSRAKKDQKTLFLWFSAPW